MGEGHDKSKIKYENTHKMFKKNHIVTNPGATNKILR